MVFIRLVKFILKHIYIILTVVTLSVLAAFFAYDNSYLNIVVRDGMTARCDCMINSYVEEDILYKLQPLFTSNYVYNVYNKEAEKFNDFEATSNYRYSINVGIAWVWPWSKTAKITVEERVVNLSMKYTGDKEIEKEDYPTWVDGKYLVTCSKKNGVWKIDSISFVEALSDPEKKPLNTKTPTQTDEPIETPLPDNTFLPAE